MRATDVWLPDGAVFVVSNCCVELNKAATSHFNTRVAECRLAAQVRGQRSRHGIILNLDLGGSLSFLKDVHVSLSRI